jgi:hypothetical protein
MHVLELRDGHVHLAADGHEEIAINNSFNLVVNAPSPIGDDELFEKTGMSLAVAAELLDRVHSVDVHREGLWFSLEQLRWLERLTTGVLDGSIDILDDWELVGVDEQRYELLHRDIQRALAEALQSQAE